MEFRWIWWKSNWIDLSSSELSTQCECVFVLVHTMEIWFLLLNGRFFFSHSCVWLYLCKVPSINNNTRGKKIVHTLEISKRTKISTQTYIYWNDSHEQWWNLNFLIKYKPNRQITTAKIHSHILTHKIHTQNHWTNSRVFMDKKNIVKYTTSSRWTEHTPIHGHLLIVWRRCIVRQTHGLLWSETWAK